MIENKFFPEVHGNFGFGCMRLPMNGEEVDQEQFDRMVDAFLAAGFNYFDTAHGYLSGKSETALRAGLTSRYPRESYILTDKVSSNFFEKEEDVRPYFESMLAACGVEYFDFLLMHAQSSRNYEQYQRCRAYEIAQELKAEGKVRHVGLSFHDTAEFLDKILTDHPEVEVVQLQLNYMDWEDPKVQSRACYEVCVKHGKPVIVMEPVKGGRLAGLHPEAQAILDDLHGGSAASYAVRFAASLDNVHMVLSGMSDTAQMSDNLSYMKDFQLLSAAEQGAVEQVAALLRSLPLIPCTACRYCTDGCPMNIDIPRIFSVYNILKTYPGASAGWEYSFAVKDKGKASDCVQCGQCEDICPQQLPIRELLAEVAQRLEK